MKTLMILILCSSLFSCSNGDSQGLSSLLRRIDSLENHIASLSHERDSLAKIATRWEYGRDYGLYANDCQGGNSVSWRCARSSDRLKFDASLLDQHLIDVSKSSDYEWSNVSISDLMNNPSEQESMSNHIEFVNTKFESDRFNYLYTVIHVNAMNEAVYRNACDLADTQNNSDLTNSYTVDAYAGLLYKKLYEVYYKDMQKNIETTGSLLETAIRYDLTK